MATPTPMPRPLDIVLVVVDSLRAASLQDRRAAPRARTPFLDTLETHATRFRRAYASECWTLPAHLSMFTGLLPSEHGAHFRTMAYTRPDPTIAELLAGAGFATEAITRNPVFEGSLPGVTRGFQHVHRPVADVHGVNPLSLMLALSKPRFRRQIRTTGFIHPLQRESRAFLTEFARATIPADVPALDLAVERMRAHRRAGRRFFVFLNLYDVHAPYPPSPASIFWPARSAAGWLDRLVMPFVLPSLGGHAYLREGFRLSETSRRLLLARYLRAIELMDLKLAAFWSALGAEGLLDDTLCVLTSDHGEAFGDHALYLHDASVYQTHLHVPLWVHHPALAPAVVDDVVATRDLFALMRQAGLGHGVDDTLLDAEARGRRPVALAEHFHYPHVPNARARYRHDLAAAITAEHKVIVRPDGVEHYDLRADPDEEHPATAPLAEFLARLPGGGRGLGSWSARHAVES